MRFLSLFYTPALPIDVLLGNRRKGTGRKGDETAKLKADAHVSLVKQLIGPSFYTVTWILQCKSKKLKMKL